jgi:hypothetical protein
MRPRDHVLVFGFFLAAALLFSSCSDDDDDDPEFELVAIGGDDARIYDHEFSGRQYFFLWDPDTAAAFTFDPDQHEINGADLAVFLNTNDNDADRRQGKELLDEALVTLSGDPEEFPRFTDQFYRLTANEDYFFFISERSAYPILILRSKLAPEWTLAASYRVRDRSTQLVVYNAGNYFERASGDTVWLKMLFAPRREKPSDNLHVGPWAPTRRLELKNIYNLGARSIGPESFTMSIHLDTALKPDSLDGVSYLEILGLDLLNNETLLAREDSPSGARGPDGKVDPGFIDYENGLLFFPDLRPFDPSSIDLNGSSTALTGTRAPSRERPRSRALGHLRSGDFVPGAPPLYGYHYERLPEPQAGIETNSALYDRREIEESYRKYYITGTFRSYTGLKSRGPLN